MGNAGYGNHTDNTKSTVESERSDPKSGDTPSSGTRPSGKPEGKEEPREGNAGAPAESDRMPAAGPHADPELTNPVATPDTGVLTPAGEHDDMDSTSG